MRSFKDKIKIGMSTLALMLVMGFAFGQEKSERLIKAEKELIALEDISTADLTKLEKKALKKDKRRLKRIINNEYSRMERQANLAQFGSPTLIPYRTYYDRFGRPFYMDALGYPIYHSRIYRPRFYRRAPVCVYRPRPKRNS